MTGSAVYPQCPCLNSRRLNGTTVSARLACLSSSLFTISRSRFFQMCAACLSVSFGSFLSILLRVLAQLHLFVHQSILPRHSPRAVRVGGGRVATGDANGRGWSVDRDTEGKHSKFFSTATSKLDYDRISHRIACPSASDQNGSVEVLPKEYDENIKPSL